jgi:MYXO-CTERM domain-containing protein
MGAGATFTDPAGGVTFKIDEIDPSHANVTVTMDKDGGGPQCLGGAAFTAPGPGIESCSAAPIAPGNGGVSGSTGGVSGAGGSTTGSGGRPGTGGGAAGGRGGTTSGTGGAVGSTGGAGGRANGSGGAMATGGTTGTGTGGSIMISTGGTPGTGGAIIVSTGGSIGSGGSVVVSTGGSGTILGTGGMAGPTGPGVGDHPDVTGGCACSTAGGDPSGIGSALALAAMIAFGSARRHRRRQR